MSSTLPADNVSRLLEQRAQQLRDEIASAQARGADVDLHEVLDRKEEASEQTRMTIDSAGIERDLTELRRIDASRQRLDEGRYGLCIDCTESIEPARLRAQPAALRCTECQREAERRARGTRIP